MHKLLDRLPFIYNSWLSLTHDIELAAVNIPISSECSYCYITALWFCHPGCERLVNLLGIED